MNLIKIKEALDEKKSERERLLGEKSIYVAQLKKLGYKTIKSAEGAMSKMEKELDKLQEDYNDQLQDFEDKYKELLA